MWPHIVLGFIWLEAVFWNPSVASLYKWISTFCENILCFSELLNWEKWEWAETENPQLSCEHSQMMDGSEFSSRFISLKSTLSFCLLKVWCDFCSSLRRCAGVGSVCCIYEWQKVSKLAVLPCGLERGGASEEPWLSTPLDKELGNAWNGVWFPMWSPCSPAQSCKVLHSAPLSLTFQKAPVQLRRINSCSQELERRWKACDDTRQPVRTSLGIVVLRNFRFAKVNLTTSSN